jgi:hypothetical protein
MLWIVKGTEGGWQTFDSGARVVAVFSSMFSIACLTIAPLMALNILANGSGIDSLRCARRKTISFL